VWNISPNYNNISTVEKVKGNIQGDSLSIISTGSLTVNGDVKISNLMVYGILETTGNIFIDKALTLSKDSVLLTTGCVYVNGTIIVDWENVSEGDYLLLQCIEGDYTLSYINIPPCIQISETSIHQLAFSIISNCESTNNPSSQSFTIFGRNEVGSILFITFIILVILVLIILILSRHKTFTNIIYPWRKK